MEKRSGYLEMSEAAERIGVSVVRVYQYVQSGRLRTVEVPNGVVADGSISKAVRRLVLEEDVKALVRFKAIMARAQGRPAGVVSFEPPSDLPIGARLKALRARAEGRR